MSNNKFSIILIILFVLFISFVSCSSNHDKSSKNVETIEIQKISYSGIEEYNVKCFETLSDIAVKYIPSKEYMSDWIADVKRLNGRKTNDIYFGEVIKVYYY